MRSDNAYERRHNKSPYKLQPIRKVFEMWNNTVQPVQGVFILGTNFIVYKRLLTFGGRCAFRNKIQPQPGKYEIKFWVICDSQKRTHRTKSFKIGNHCCSKSSNSCKISGRTFSRTEWQTVFTVAKDGKISRNMYGFQRDSIIVFKFPNKNKVVALLSTIHNDRGIESSG